MTHLEDVTAVPELFRRAAASMRNASTRPEIHLAESGAPRRIAPYACAFTADVVQDERELATGRLVLLHDPHGQEGWDGTFRLVTYLRADLEQEIASDPLLVRVVWTWLTESLHARDAAYRTLGGTVTRSASEGFGALEHQSATTEMELRAAWTPAEPAGAAHMHAWCDVLATSAGLPPVHRA